MKNNFFTKLFTSKERVVTRIAPSPTGLFHVGTARSALFNYLYAKKYGGTFIVRIEDTDTERSKKKFERDILDGLEWLGLTHDALYRQSERTVLYRTYIEKLVESGKAYTSEEEAKDGSGVKSVVRLKNPGVNITFFDEIRGEITFNTTELGDFVIARSFDSPLYHLAVVIDDFEMKVTHVIRGDDHISNTPRQILIQQALGFPRPKYAHIPLILAPDRSKLSKRHEVPGLSISLTAYKEAGYLPEAFTNYLALLGWNPGTDRELYELNELSGAFSLEQIQKGGAIFDLTKLQSVNREYMRKLSPETYLEHLAPFLPDQWKENPTMLDKMLPLISERLTFFSELATLHKAGEFSYFFEAPQVQTPMLLWKGEGSLEEVKKYLIKIAEILEESDSFSKETLKELVWPYAEEQGRGRVLWPLRVALTGKEKSPDPFVVASLLGKEETLHRLKTLCEKL